MAFDEENGTRFTAVHFHDLGPLGAECSQQRGEDARANGLIRADAQRAGVAVAEGIEVGLRGS